MKKINRAVCGTVAVLGVFVAFMGLVLSMCDTPDLRDQLQCMLLGTALIAGGSAMAYIGGSARWTEGPYAGL